MAYKYDLGQKAIVISTGDYGIIIGRAEFSARERAYQIQCLEEDDTLKEIWSAESNTESFVEI